MTFRYHASIFLAILFTAAATVPASAQIAIEADDLTSVIGTSAEMSSLLLDAQASLQTVADATGENQTYDFSQVTASDTLEGFVSYHGSADDLPGGAEFPTSNYVMELQLGMESADADSSVWIFNRIDDDSLLTLGGSFIFSDPNTQETDTMTLAYDPPRVNYPLPLNYGDSWVDETSYFGSDMTITSEVEGWGTLIVPGGGTYEALRVRVTTTSSTFGFEQTTTHLDFITENNQVSAQLNLAEDGETAEGGELVLWSTATATEDEELPSQVRLSQNYPNPFNPSTAFDYELTHPQHVRLTVHDMLGRTVAVLVDGMRPAGVHDVAFDASDLSSGTYLYRLHTSAGTSTRVMTLAK